jgi:hypothetical protein
VLNANLSRGVVASVSFFYLFFFCFISRLRPQPINCLAPALFAYGIPVYAHFSSFIFVSHLRPPVVVAFGPFALFLYFPQVFPFGLWRCWPIFQYDVLYRF